MEIYSIFLISPATEIMVLSNKHQKYSYENVFVSTFDHILISVFLIKLQAKLVGILVEVQGAVFYVHLELCP
jgi:hypothetical protein